jgi:CRP-like cAMP-binding protein
MNQDISSVLSAVPLFKTLDPGEIAALSQLMAPQQFTSNQPLMVEGHPPPGLYVLLEGKVAVCKNQGPSVDHLCDLDAGECVGELEIFERSACSASVLAYGTVKTAVILEENLMLYFSQYPTAAMKIMWQMVHVLAARLRQSNVNYTSLKAITEGMLPE